MRKAHNPGSWLRRGGKNASTQLQYSYPKCLRLATHSLSEKVMGKDGEAGLNLSVERFSPTLEKALWVKGKAWRQKQTSGEVSDQL